MGSAAKRQAGSTTKWLGFRIHNTLGMVTISNDKRIKRQLALRDMANGVPVSMDTITSATYFVQHLVHFVQGDAERLMQPSHCLKVSKRCVL